MNSSHKYRAGICAGIFILASAALSAQPAALDVQLAREPATVVTTARREFRGLLDGLRDGRLHLRVARDGGEVGYSFAPSEIAELTLPGAALEAQSAELCDRSAWTDALPLLEALGRQRLRYLPVLTTAQRRPLFLLVQTSARAGNPLTTLGYVNELLPTTNDPAERAILLDARLGAHVRLGNTTEVRRLAESWCAAADPAGGSALGWEILAQLAYNAGDHERARWIALQPVVFSSHLPTEHLDACYALAVSAAHRLGDADHAMLLYREMRARGLVWPGDSALAAIGQHYAERTTTIATAPATPVASPETSSPAAPPVADEKLPLEKVRKLVAPSPTL